MGLANQPSCVRLIIFFRNLDATPTNLSSLVAEDFYSYDDVSKPIEITVSFVDLSPEAANDLSDYVRQGKLIVSAVAHFDPVTGRAEVKQFGQRLGMKKFMPFFERYGDGAPAGGASKAIFDDLEKNDADLAAANVKKTKDGMYEADLLPLKRRAPRSVLPSQSPDQFYGVSGEQRDRLSKYIQWIYIPAVKSASDEQTGTKNSALGKLLARTVNAQTNFQKAL